MNNQRDLNKLFKPNSVAILGASRDENKIGHIVLKNIIDSGFAGKIFPVNPNSTEILNIKCYAEYARLPTVPDLAIISLPVGLVLLTLEQIAAKGTKNIVIFSAGFKEAGPEGIRLENALIATAEKLQLNIIGPNCLGFASTPAKLNATFSKAGNLPGNLRFMSQSGALASAIFDWAKENEIGFSEFITMGNKAVLNENHILQYWLDAKETKVAAVGMSRYQPVGLYLESIIDGQKFLQLAKQVAKDNPIFILKPGKSQHAQQAIKSHTGSMAGDAAVQEAAFAEAGIIRCDGVEDMFDLSKAFSWENAPKGPRVAVVSNAGGPAVISTDVIEKEGLQLATLSKATTEKLKTNLPRAASVLNPIDVLGDALADRYQEALVDVLSEKNVDAVVVILTPQIMTEIEVTAKLIGQLSTNYGKPIICCFMGGELAEKGEKILNSFKIPSYRFPERAIKVLASMWKWQQSVKSQKPVRFAKSEIDTKKIEKIVAAVEPGSKVLSVGQSEVLLALAGIKIPVSQLVENTAQAKKFLKKYKGPMVLKISSPDMMHKTDGGGVMININSNSDIDKAWQELNAVAKKLPKKFSYSFHAQQQIEHGLELIAGVKYDGSFGNVLMFGAGGILAELIGDSNLATLPLDIDKTMALIVNSKAYKLLKGFRGHKPYAIEKLAELLVKLGTIAQASSYFSELTVNPIIVTDKEAWAVDPRIILR